MEKLKNISFKQAECLEKIVGEEAKKLYIRTTMSYEEAYNLLYNRIFDGTIDPTVEAVKAYAANWGKGALYNPNTLTVKTIDFYDANNVPKLQIAKEGIIHNPNMFTFGYDGIKPIKPMSAEELASKTAKRISESIKNKQKDEVIKVNSKTMAEMIKEQQDSEVIKSNAKAMEEYEAKVAEKHLIDLGLAFYDKYDKSKIKINEDGELTLIVGKLITK